MVATSKVVKASSRSPSARSTIPEDIVRELGIKTGDVLEWTIAQKNDKKGAFIRKLE
jgi:bifunctional DNA-binding transcriptional regulator/antitoxin component of YhaV-PrlF toxin-antitoxin module